jgi:hypothetical protein
MPLLIICSHCNYTVRNSDVSPATRLCPYCSQAMDTAPEETETPIPPEAPQRRGPRKRRTRLVMTEPATPRVEKPRVPDPEPIDPTPAPVPPPVAVPASVALAVEVSDAGDDRWAPLGRGAALVRAGLVVEWAAVTVFVVVVGAVLYLFAPDPRMPANLRANAFQQELRVLGPSLLLIPAAGLVVGGALVAAGRVTQARVPWDLPSARAFRATAGCELFHFVSTLACSGQALLVYLTQDAVPGAPYEAWVGVVFALSLASRFVADLATVTTFGLASAALPSEALRRRTAAVTISLQLLGAVCACFLAGASLSGALGDMVRSAEVPAPTLFVVPVAAVYAGFTVYTLLGIALQRAAWRAAAEGSVVV